MLHKAWNSKGEMPYCFPRSSIKFQGQTVQNITNFDPNWAFPDYRPVAAFKSLRFALWYRELLNLLDYSVPSHYMNQCWPDSLTHICGTWGRWVNFGDILFPATYQFLGADHMWLPCWYPIISAKSLDHSKIGCQKIKFDSAHSVCKCIVVTWKEG